MHITHADMNCLTRLMLKLPVVHIDNCSGTQHMAGILMPSHTYRRQ